MNRFQKIFTYIIWFFLIYFCAYYAVEVSNGGNGWKTGDWLINYSAGPVRRGLIGSILIHIADYGISLRWLTYFAQVGLYISLFYLVMSIYVSKQRHWGWLLFLLSPAFVMFPFYDLQGGFRKEILVFNVFALLALFYVKKTINERKIILIVLLYILAVFSHELSAFMLPFFIYLLLLCYRKQLIKHKEFLITAAVFCLVSSVGLAFSVLYKGDDLIVSGVCESLVRRGFDLNICNGAISWLSKDSSYGFNQVASRLRQYLSLYSFIFILAAAPIFLTNWLKRETYFLLLVGAIFMLPLYLFAIDWGRWIHIFIFFVFCLMLIDDVDLRVWRSNFFIILTFFYLSLWNVPHCCSDSISLSNSFVGKAYGISKQIYRKLI